MTPDSCEHPVAWNFRKILAWLWLALLIAGIAYTIPAANRRAAKDRSDKQLAVVLDSIDEGLVIVDSKMRIELFSSGAEKIFHVAADKVVGNTFEWMIPDSVVRQHCLASEQFWKNPDVGIKTLACLAQTYDKVPVDVLITIRGCKIDGDWKLCAKIVPVKNLQPAIAVPSKIPAAIGTDPRSIGPYQRQFAKPEHGQIQVP